MSKFVDGLRKTAKRILDDQNVQDGFALILGSLMGIVVALIKKR